MVIEAMFTLTEEFLVHSLSENVLESVLQTRPCYYLTKATALRLLYRHTVDWAAMKKILYVVFTKLAAGNGHYGQIWDLTRT